MRSCWRICGADNSGFTAETRRTRRECRPQICADDADFWFWSVGICMHPQAGIGPLRSWRSRGFLGHWAYAWTDAGDDVAEVGEDTRLQN